MYTSIEIRLDTECGLCIVQEDRAEAVAFHVNTSSLESIAYDVGRAVEDYLTGLF